MKKHPKGKVLRGVYMPKQPNRYTAQHHSGGSHSSNDATHHARGPAAGGAVESQVTNRHCRALERELQRAVMLRGGAAGTNCMPLRTQKPLLRRSRYGAVPLFLIFVCNALIPHRRETKETLCS
jgi:hypothetical protein